MRLPLVCAQCMRDDVMSAQIISSIEFKDDGRYEVACQKGHNSLIVLQQQKFEVLFDIGAYAIVDGYYREAVSSFSSSLERFYEFFIKTVLHEKEVDEQVLSATWKHVSNQSERQLGAFIMLYTSELGRSPTLLSNSRISFRNDVVHKGKIPSRQEALEYGQAVLNVIRPVLNETKEMYPNGVNKTIFQYMKECRGVSGEDQAIATMSVPTIVSLTVAEPGYDTRTIEDAIAGLRRW